MVLGRFRTFKRIDVRFIRSICSLWLIGFLVLSLHQKSIAQNFNPPYPRIGQIYFYKLGQGPIIWKNHDLVIIRFQFTNLGKEIKEKNPDVLLFACTDKIVSNKNEWPKAWYLKDTQGNLISSYSQETGYLNITNDCPLVDLGNGPQRFNEYFPRYLIEHIDWRYTDGIMLDYWAEQLWGTVPDRVDLNGDGIAEGADFINQKWAEGNATLIANFRKLTDKPIIAHESRRYYLNGNGFEFWSKNENKKRLLDRLFELRDNCQKPVINFCEGYGYEFGPDFRVDFTSAMLGDGFYGHDEGTIAHRYTFLHDEYEANLGYPTGGPQEIKDGVWVRYFDRGLVISNISGVEQTVNASELSGGPYYRYLSNQDPIFNDGTQFESVTFQPYDGIMLFKEPTVLCTPVVIDNVPINMTSLGQSPANFTGSWEQVVRNHTKSNTGYSLGFSWGYESSPYAINRGQGTAVYRPNFGIGGRYEVFEWHPDVSADGFGPGNSAVEITIVSKDGTVKKTIDQTQNQGRWNSLGVYQFDPGNTGYVTIRANGNGVTAADAVRFVRIESSDFEPPNSPRNLHETEKSEHHIKLEWDPPQVAADGDDASYYTILRDGKSLGSTVNLYYVDSGLEENTSYRYEVYAYDDAGNRSESPASLTVSTAADQVPPVVTGIFIVTSTLLKITFSEPVDATTATDVNNYFIDNNISVVQARLDNGDQVIWLKTSAHTSGVNYTLTIQNIKDQAKIPNVMSAPVQFNYSFSNQQLTINISGDDRYELYVNGNKVGESTGWEIAEQYFNIPLNNGQNVIAVKAENRSGVGGLVAEILGPGFQFFSNPIWKVSTSAQNGWEQLNFDDSGWTRAQSYGLLMNGMPWRQFTLVQGIAFPEKTHWIWSADNRNDEVVYFRFVFDLDNLDNTPPNPPKHPVVH